MSENAAEPVHFCPQGELTIYTAEQQKAMLMAAIEGQSAIVLDLSQVSELDTAGLQLLMLAKLESERRNLPFSMTGHSPAVVEVFDLCNLASFFGDPLFIPSEQSATQSATGRAS